ncbi:MAG: hypothetical protein IK119_01870 [Bacteroidales bacterium]|nr:hypothetical protein [Bacteroidales bacterium]
MACTITFSDGSTVVIKDGAQGEQGLQGEQGQQGEQGPEGKTPEISITLGEDGIYYWTVDGQLLKDKDGKPVPVTTPGAQGAQGEQGEQGEQGQQGEKGQDGITPLFGTNNEHKLIVSYDNGQTWIPIGLSVIDGSAFTSAYIDDEKSTDDYIVLVVGDTEVQIPKEKAFALKIKYEGDLSSVGANAGETIGLEYAVEGVSAGDEITVDILSATPGITAKIVKIDEVSGYITIAVPAADPEASEPAKIEGKVFVFADNNKGKTNIKVISLEEGEIAAVADVSAQAPAAGGEFELTVTTNKEYNVNIDDAAASWLSVVKTKATHTDKLTIVAAENKTGAYRVGTITINDRASGDKIAEYTVVQQPSAEVATELASVRELADGTEVSVKNAIVVAASKEGVLVVDEDGGYIYVAVGLNPAIERGDVIDFKGVKQTTEETKVIYVDATKGEVVDQDEPYQGEIPDLPWLYIGYGEEVNSINTGSTGVVKKEESGKYYVSTNLIPHVYFETPLGIDLSTFEGKLVSFTGYSNGVYVDLDEDWNFIGYYNFIVNSIEEVKFQVNANWTVSYKEPFDYYGYSFEQFTNTVTAGEDYYANGLGVSALYPVEGELSAEQIEALAMQEALKVSDDVQYYFSRYTETIDDEATNETGSIYPESPSTYGKFIVFATGLNEGGYPTGKYAYAYFEKENPYKDAEYKDFIGSWVVDGAKWDVSEKVAGETYSVSAPIMGLDGIELDGAFVDGTFAFMEKNLGAIANGYDNVTLSANAYKSTDHFGLGVNNDTPQPIFYVKALKDGTYEIVPGTMVIGSTEYTINYMEVLGFQEGVYKKELKYSSVPSKFEAYVPPVHADYEDFIGTWNVPSTSGNTVWTIAEKVKGESYAITGIGGVENNGNGEPVVVEGTYTEEGTLQIAVQRVSGDYQDGGVAAYDLLSGIYNSSKLTTAVGTVIVTITYEDEKLNLKPAVISGYDFESLTFFHRTNSWYILGARTPLPTQGLPAGGAVDEGYSQWIGTWTVTEANGGSYNITVAENVPGVSYMINGINGFNYSFINAKAVYDADSKSMLLCGGNSTNGLVSSNVNIGDTEQNYNLYLLALVDVEGTTYYITGDYYLASFSKNDSGQVVFTPGTVKLTAGDFTINGQGVYCFGMTDPSSVHTLTGEVVSMYPLTLTPAGSATSVSSVSDSESLSVSRVTKGSAAKISVPVSKANVTDEAKKSGVAKEMNLNVPAKKESFKFNR